MSKIKRYLVVPASLVAMIFMSSSLLAQCNSCGNNAGTFGYPSGCQGCGAGGLAAGGVVGGAINGFKSNVDAYKADYRINRARASAWPQPFSCWDRESYFAILNQQYATGTQIAHTLTSEYFVPESNKLNRNGEMRVAWIMQNAPQNDKNIFVYEDKTGPTLDQRMTSIREFTNRYYGHMGNATVAKTQLLPNQIPATFQLGYLERYAEAQPDPVIPVESGSTVNSSVGN